MEAPPANGRPEMELTVQNLVKHEKAAAEGRRAERLAALRRMEAEYLAVRGMAPGAAVRFIDARPERAAARVQSAWRGARVRRSLGLIRSALGEARHARAATVIQHAARRRARVAQDRAQARAAREVSRKRLELELPHINRRIVEAATQFRLVEPRRAHELAADAQRTLRDWAELRQRSGLRAADRARARAEAGAIFGSLQRAAGGAARGAHGGLADALAHADIAHLRPAARRGADAPLADAHAREHRAMSRLAELDAEAGAAARKATAGLRARAEARS